ncbi:MAG: hypothetical protein HFJ94_06280 [Muribaculaceae bacterium]|jgi:hypothetical protein|nr:hypothetical protein [Muribaculaceae bacterium]
MEKYDKKPKTSAWLIIGVLVLIALLIVWLTVADFTGNTDVNAVVYPAVKGAAMLLVP